MKKLIVFAFFLINFSVFSQSLLKISGEIKNPTERKVVITLFRDWVSEEETYEATLNSSNQFSLEIPINHIAYLDFYYGDEGFHYWIVEPADNIFMSFDGNDFWKYLKTSGKGSEKWTYYNLQHKKFEEQRDWQVEANDWQTKLPMQKYFEKLDLEQTLQLNFMHTYKNSLSSDFYELRKADIIGAIQNMKVDYLAGKKYDDLSEEDVVKNLKISEVRTDCKARSLEFGNMELELMEIEFNKTANKRKEKLSTEEEYQIIKSHFETGFLDRALTERLLALKVKLLLEAGTSAESLNLVNDYLAFNQNRDYKNYFNQKNEIAQTLTQGSAAKPFSLVDIDGKEVNLSDFLGKVVLIDFWASWCGPCIHDMKLMEPVKEHFKNQAIVFLYISIDNESEWRESVKQYAVNGINLRTDETSNLSKDYGISGVPAYFLIDKKGNFASTNVADPSEDDGKVLIKQIETALK